MPETNRMSSDSSRFGRQANRTRTAEVATASGPMKRSRADGGTKRLNASTPDVSPRACAARMTPTASVPPPRSRASGGRAPSEIAGGGGGDARGRFVDRREPAEQHRAAQHPVREDQARPGEDAGQPARPAVLVGRRRGRGPGPDPALDDDRGDGEGAGVDDE